MAVDPRRLQAAREAARTPGQIFGDAEPGALSGSLSAIPQGVVTGVAQVEGVLAGAAAATIQPVYDALETATGVTPWNPFASLRDQADVWAQQYRPDPLSTGMAGQVMFDVGRVLTQVGVGAAATAATGGAGGSALLGGAVVAGGSTGRATALEMQERGADVSTAVNAGFIDALTVGGGVLLPGAIGYQSLAAPLAATGAGLSRGAYYGANVAYGVGANVALGVAQRGATHDLLESGGYTAMAKQYAPLDAAAITAEGVLGGVFSAIGARAGLPMRAGPTVDAALAARDAKHSAVDTSPGVPADQETAGAHGRALDSAIRALLDGRPVDVSQTGAVDGQYIMGRRSQAVIDAARDEYGLDIPASARYTPSTRLADLPSSQRTALRYDAPELNEYAAQVEQQYGLPAGLINGLKNAGERSNSNQVSPAGASGVMQFMPENLRKYGVTDASDPVQMIDAAGRYLRDTMRQYGGDVDAVIADYNGGPRQAREVLAGRQPKARETREYLARVRQWLGRDMPEAGQALPVARAAAGDVAEIPAIPAERARVASSIERELAAAEGERADLIAKAGGEAEIGQVTEIRAELVELQAQRADIGSDASLRELAKKIQATPRTSYKEALSQARRQRSAEIQALDGRIERLEGALSQNRTAAQAAQRLAVLDDEIGNLQANRAAVQEPAALPTMTNVSVRSALGELGLSDPQTAPIDAGRPAGSNPMARAPAPPRQAVARPARAEGEAAGSPARQEGDGGEARSNAQPFDDPETQAGLSLLDEQGDIVVPVQGADGETINVSLRQALADADAELQYGRPEAFNAAVVCAMTRGA
ncbi:lytic transglycosylase [Orrella dioscoreae]|uniref:Lytic transglycosylase n=2 Tax=Orrella dioscoreae TaxID=1851544 RepID=A0A1C3K1Q6_9BURK|nr:lytic transglycosylase [Orrella dioscoreae]SOE49131.1 lytic transglycosylase [Orrella dioscoreae]